jgi:sarcosine oxidase subunit alpha
MNVFSVKPGDKVIMVGAGNVGLIVAYQLLQAGIQVDRVVEAAPIIGGYHVHAAKLRRCGVPIQISQSIKEVFGKDKVEGVIVVTLDENWDPIKDSERKIECDSVCLAVGLTPSTKLISQLGVRMEFVSESGGFVALHDDSMQTTIKNVYVAGDSSGIEEASTAMIEGKIAGVSAALSLGYNKNARDLIKQYITELENFRDGPFGEQSRAAKKKIKKLLEKKHV